MRHESYIARQDKFVARQKLSSYLVFQLVARHHLNACYIFTLACDKVRLIQVWRQTRVLYHILNMARTGKFSIHSLWWCIIMSFGHTQMFWQTKGKFRNTKQSWVFCFFSKENCNAKASWFHLKGRPNPCKMKPKLLKFAKPFSRY